MTDIALQSGQIAFSPRARLLKLIGAELISDEVVAITELVKNAHDADATNISIQFISASRPDGEILIRDDGTGMGLDALLTRWMQPAGSTKGRVNNRHTAKGRRMLGEKGVGRFAADKLAAQLELVSRQAGEPTEVRAVFDWDQFDGDERMLSDVRSHWEVRPAEWLEGHGTVLRLTGLRSRWTERLYRRLSTRLSRLVSPFAREGDFRIHVESDDFPAYTGEVTSGFLDQAPYRVEVDFDGDDSLQVRLNGQRATRIEWRSEGKLSCGPVRARLFAFDLETEALARIGPRTEVRSWLREWSGVSVYRDGFRIWPYGEPHDDWLRLDQRRVNNPVTRLSNNQVVGFVEISGDRNPELRDQTNREGLIHNDAFADLQRLVLFAFQLVEAERQASRHPNGVRNQRKLTRAGTAPDLISLPNSIEKLAEQAPDALGQELRRVAARARVRILAEETTKRRMLEGYSDLAVIGHTAAVVGRSVELSLEQLRGQVADVMSAMGPKSKPANADLARSLSRLEGAIGAALQRVATVTQGSSATARRRRGIDVPAELARLKSLLHPLLVDAKAEFIVDAPDGALLRTEMRPELFQSLVSVLVTNSLEWKAPERDLRLMVSVATTEDDGLELLFSDNGRGVNQALEGTLFEPTVSGKEDGAGMGLSLARHIVASHGGNISLVVDRRRKGATFQIVLPRKRSRATAHRQ